MRLYPKTCTTEKIFGQGASWIVVHSTAVTGYYKHAFFHRYLECALIIAKDAYHAKCSPTSTSNQHGFRSDWIPRSDNKMIAVKTCVRRLPKSIFNSFLPILPRQEI